MAATTSEVFSPMASVAFHERVTAVQHYTDRLFSFRITRPPSMRFRSGQFIMLGMMVDGEPLMRAYSIASPGWAEELEFFSIKVPNGPLTSRLQHIKIGDEILLSAKPVGTLVLNSLTRAKRLFMFSTGTGIAPFASLMRDPDTYETFDEVYLTHTCRQVAELKYGQELTENLMEDPLCGEEARKQFRLYNSVTREDFPYQGRITTLIENGKLFTDLGIPPLNVDTDRAMICGSMEMTKDISSILKGVGMKSGTNSRPAEYVVERAFVG